MGRRTVWISDELEALAVGRLENVNWSAALQAGIRALLECDHGELACTSCGEATTRGAMVGPPLEELYRKIMWELGLKAAQPGYVGAAAVVRRVAIDQGVPGIAGVAIPRATRATYEHRKDEAFLADQAANGKPPAPVDLPTEADSRRRHPTARAVPANHPGPQPAIPEERSA